jgi:hypothetical protein
MGGVAGMRGKETVRDMVLSLAAIGLVVAGIYVFGIPHDSSANPAKTIDYRVDLDTARRAAPYPVAAPAPGSLPAGWRATSVSYDPAGDDGAAWHLGFLDPEGQYVAIEQSNDTTGTFLPDVTQQAKRTAATQKVRGETWQRYAGGRYDALVLRQPKVTTVVTGTAPYGQLATMAAVLDTGKTGSTGAGATGSSGSAAGAGKPTSPPSAGATASTGGTAQG